MRNSRAHRWVKPNPASMKSGREESGVTLQIQSQLRTHVSTLATAPRNRISDPDHLAASRSYVVDYLTSCGWTVEQQPFTVPAGIGVSDAGRPSAKWFPVRPRKAMHGVNIIATRGGPIDAGTLLIVAHLDTVRHSPGADDNASGVAAALEVAAAHPLDHTASTPIQPPEPRPPKTSANLALALADLEEAGLAGARELARTISPGAVINLESVGYYTDTAGSQHLPPGTGLAAPALVRQVRQRDSRGDFALVVHRASSSQLAEAWMLAAGHAGLATIDIQDRRPTGGLFRLVRPFDIVGSNLDRSDHGPFWDRGVPAVVVTGTAPMRNHRYHYATDTPDTLDYPRLAAVTMATATVAADWLGERTRS